MGALRATPRGSKPTMSTSSRTDRPTIVLASLAKSTPDPPGPPGLTTIEPLADPERAGTRSSAMAIVFPVGAA